MIVDCFTFFNEYDILEGRLEYLYNTVDFFVVVEADLTHSGNHKELNFLNNMSRYKNYLDKVLYFPVHIDAGKYSFGARPEVCDFSNPQWQVENAQRNHISTALDFFPKDTTVIISDVDEIPSISGITRAESMLNQKPAISLTQQMFYYNFRQCQVAPWKGTVVSKNSTVKSRNPQWFRDNRNILPSLLNGGWHLSYWGDIDAIQTKINNFAHQEFNTDKFKDPNYIKQQIESGQDLFGRPTNPFRPVDITTLDKDIVRIFNKLN